MKTSIILLLTLATIGCTTQPVQLQAADKTKIRSIAIANIVEPQRYYLHPRTSGVSPGLPLVGILGPAAIGITEPSRTEGATEQLMTSLRDHPPTLARHVQDDLHRELSARGYGVIASDSATITPQGELVDCGPAKGTADAILTADAHGILVEREVVEPLVIVRVRLLSSDCGRTLLSGTYLYGSIGPKQFTIVPLAPGVSFVRTDDAIANPQRVAAVMRQAAALLAARIAQDL